MQEAEYSFPYHHLVEIQPFSETKALFWGYEYAAYLGKILETLQTLRFSSLVDVGCGDGKLLYELSKTNSGTLVGTDFDERALQFARAFSPGLRFEQTIPHEAFEAFTLIEVLEHIPPDEIDSFFVTLKQSLAHDAVGVITVPSDNVTLIAKHYQHFNAASLSSVLEPHFTINSIQYLNAQSLSIKILQRMFSNHFFILNNQNIRTLLFDIYVRKSLLANPKTGSRIMAVVTNKN